MWPDPKWLETLSLPAKVMGGLFAFFASALFLDWLGFPRLSDLGDLARPIFVLLALMFGWLYFFAVASSLHHWWSNHSAARRAAREKEEERAAEETKISEAKERVLWNLDHLSDKEVEIFAHLLKDNKRSFLAWSMDGNLTNLRAKGLLFSPGGTHPQDNYPYTVVDFVWVALSDRRDEFLQRHAAITEKEKQKAGRRR